MNKILFLICLLTAFVFAQEVEGDFSENAESAEVATVENGAEDSAAESEVPAAETAVAPDPNNVVQYVVVPTQADMSKQESVYSIEAVPGAGKAEKPKQRVWTKIVTGAIFVEAIAMAYLFDLNASNEVDDFSPYYYKSEYSDVRDNVKFYQNGRNISLGLAAIAAGLFVYCIAF